MRHKLYLTASIILVFAVSHAWADTLELRDGSLVDGTYIGGSQNSVRFQIGTETRVFQVDEVLAITFSGKQLAPTSAPAPQTPVLQPSQPVTIPAGTILLVRNTEVVDSRKHGTGHKFTTTLEAALTANGVVVVPKGTPVYGKITQAKQSRRLAGRSELTVELTDILIGNQTRPIVTQVHTAESKRTGRKTLRRTAAGALIGGAINDSDGAKTGALVGAGLSAVTKGEKIDIPAGALLEFRLTAPLGL